MISEPDSYRYTAFVSYRHRLPDTDWARWLQEALETFETPPALVSEGYPKVLGDVFVDDTEMAAASELTKELRTALWSSRFLIVVCSPGTPHSPWVRAEITHFQHWGREDRILALLVEGNPDEAYPPELRRMRMVGEGPDATMEVMEPAGASVTEVQDKIEEELKALARDRFAAAILGCDFARLRDRQEERLRKATSTRYFHALVRRRGAPEGVGEVTAEAARRRYRTYRF
ncbi:MAG: toll/interleukin-1 receptor domain-containing protein, partial [Pseudomonadota bacterium]